MLMVEMKFTKSFTQKLWFQNHFQKDIKMSQFLSIIYNPIWRRIYIFVEISNSKSTSEVECIWLLKKILLLQKYAHNWKIWNRNTYSLGYVMLIMDEWARRKYWDQEIRWTHLRWGDKPAGKIYHHRLPIGNNQNLDHMRKRPWFYLNIFKLNIDK